MALFQKIQDVKGITIDMPMAFAVFYYKEKR